MGGNGKRRGRNGVQNGRNVKVGTKEQGNGIKGEGERWEGRRREGSGVKVLIFCGKELRKKRKLTNFKTWGSYAHSLLSVRKIWHARVHRALVHVSCIFPLLVLLLCTVAASALMDAIRTGFLRDVVCNKAVC